MAIKSVKRKLSVPQLYTLADTLGMTLTLTRGLITGECRYELELPGLDDFGFPVKLVVVASFHDKGCEGIGLLCESIGDLGVLIYHDIKLGTLQFCLLNTSRVAPSWEVIQNQIFDVKTIIGIRRKLSGAIERTFSKGEKEGVWVIES